MASEFEDFTLDNGIRCVHRNDRNPIAHVSLTIGAGTRDEGPEQHGVAHLVEHLLFKGTARRSSFRINSLLESSGGDLNAFTTREETVIHASFVRSEYAKAVDLLSDMAFNSTFDPVQMNKERNVIYDEINAYRDSPAELIYDEFEELLFVGSPLGRNILGDKRNLKKATPGQLRQFVSENYDTSQMVFTSSGGISQRRFREVCGHYLAPFPARRRSPENMRTAPPRQPRFDRMKQKNGYQAHCILGGYGYDLHDERRLGLSFLVNLLGGPLSVSRLNMQLRERYALTYSVEAGYTPYSDSGIVTVYLGCDSEKLDKSLGLVRNELRRLRDAALTGIQLARAKKQFLGQLALSNENPENLILGIGKSLLTYGCYETSAQIAARVMALTSPQLLEVANDIFSEEKLSSLIYR